MGTCGLDTIPSYNNTMLHEVHTILNPQDIVIWDSVYLAAAVCWLLASVLLLTCKYILKYTLKILCIVVKDVYYFINIRSQA